MSINSFDEKRHRRAPDGGFAAVSEAVTAVWLPAPVQEIPARVNGGGESIGMRFQGQQSDASRLEVGRLCPPT